MARMTTTASRPSWLQAGLLLAGAILLPAGLIVIGIGWYGAANTPYSWEQTSYLISGGLFGLGLAFVGGFLYFGSWLAKISADNADAMAQLSESLRDLADALAVSRAPSAEAPTRYLVTTERGSMYHAPDCTLVAERPDLQLATGTESWLKPCRVCLAD